MIEADIRYNVESSRHCPDEDYAVCVAEPDAGATLLLGIEEVENPF